MIPPLASGMMMRSIVPRAVVPSIAAASSSSTGNVRKNEISRNTVNGIEIPTYTRFSPMRLLVRYSRESITNSGIMITCAGTPRPSTK